MEDILEQVLCEHYYGLTGASPRGVNVFVRLMMEVALAPSVMTRVKDPLETEPLLRNATQLQRAVYRAAGEYYLAAKPKVVDRKTRAETVGRIIAAQLNQQVEAAALREAAEYQGESDLERASHDADERRRARSNSIRRPLYPV